MMYLQNAARREYTRAAQLLDGMEKMRRVWMSVRPAPPLKRSDLGLLGTLVYLDEEKGEKMVNASQLATMMHQSLPGISQKLRFLEENGYIRRQVDDKDRRVAAIVLTPKGRQAAGKNLDEMLGRLESALDLLGEDDSAALLALMEKLGNAMAQTLPQTGENTESKPKE